MPPNVCNDSEDGIITLHIYFNSQRQWLIILWKEINGFEPDVPFFFPVGSNCLHKSNKHQPRNIKRQECVFHKAQWVLFCSTISTFVPAVWACNGYVSKFWQFGVSMSVADYRLHVLWHHAKQVGAADLSAWLHEEPPGLPPRPPCTSVALLQLHVHACWVRTSTYHMLISAEQG